MGVNADTMGSDFLPLLRDPAKSSKEFSWDDLASGRIARAALRADSLKLYHEIEAPIKKTQSLVDADYVEYKDDSLLSSKILDEGAEITPSVALEVKRRAQSWDIYKNAIYSEDGKLANMVVSMNNTDFAVMTSVASSLKAILAANGPRASGPTWTEKGSSAARWARP